MLIINNEIKIDHHKYPTVVVGDNYTLSTTELMKVYQTMVNHFVEEDVAGWLEQIAYYSKEKYSESDVELADKILNSREDFDKFVACYNKATDWSDDGFEESMQYAFKQMK